MNRKATRQCTLFVLALALSSAVHPLSSDSEQKLVFDAEEWEFNETLGVTTYIGSVQMQQGSMKINADKIMIYGKLDRATKVIAIGSPAHFQQTPDETAQPVTARANRLEYEVGDKTLVLLGDAELNQEEMQLSGNKIEYDVKKAVVKAGSKVDGSEIKRRVHMVIPPKVLQSDDKQ